MLIHNFWPLNIKLELFEFILILFFIFLPITWVKLLLWAGLKGQFFGLLKKNLADYYHTFGMYFKHDLLHLNCITDVSLNRTSPLKLVIT